ncbi:MAG: nuclear transport factor 2 family protein [Myxococcales bacterium]|nr:MAG: nuclear transport factor 2 family protein [Myxococcales bacterium]
MTRDSDHPHLAHVRRYFEAIEQGAAEDVLASFFTANVRQHEFPNRLVERGAARTLADMLEGNRRGQQVVTHQRYVIDNALVDGDRLALELRWSAELKVPLGKLAIGDRLSANCGVFFRFEDGRISEQHNFDCFEPF